MENWREVFEVGMDRQVRELIPFPEGGPILNLGAGKKVIAGTVALDASTGWDGETIHYADEEVAGAYAFHFMEHLTKDQILRLLRNLEKAFKPQASLVCVTPMAGCEASFQDLDHKSFWTVDTWKNLFQNPYYDGTMPRNWRFVINASIIMGVAERNLAVVSQIVKLR